MIDVKQITNFDSKGNVPVLNDEELVRYIAEDLLTDAGYTVTTAKEKTEAINLDANNPGGDFDAVILDLNIPNGMGGLEALRQLRRFDSEVHAIVSSGANSQISHHPKSFGFSATLPKPYTGSELFSIPQSVELERY